MSVNLNIGTFSCVALANLLSREAAYHLMTSHLQWSYFKEHYKKLTLNSLSSVSVKWLGVFSFSFGFCNLCWSIMYSKVSLKTIIHNLKWQSNVKQGFMEYSSFEVGLLTLWEAIILWYKWINIIYWRPT